MFGSGRLRLYSGRMRAEDSARRRLYLAWLLLVAAIDFLPVLRLGGETTARTWALAGLAGLLGALLASWVWRWLFRRQAEPRPTRRSVPVWIRAGAALIVAVRAAPAGVQMIYSTALEGSGHSW